MCGEVFSEKYTAEEKAAPGLAKPHPLARPGRWSVVYSGDDPRVSTHERAYFDREDGFATEDEAKAAKKHQVGYHSDWQIVPPSETFGDHDPSLLSREQLERLARAILNNDQAGFEALRPELAAASAPKPKRAKADVAEAIVNFLTDDTGEHGNGGDYIIEELVNDPEDDDGEYTLELDDRTTRALAALISEYRAAV